MTQSIVILVPIAAVPAANLALAAYFGDPIDAENLTIRCSATGQEPATHKALHVGQEPAGATMLKDWPTGALPTSVGVWADYGLDEASALAAGGAMLVNCLSCDTSSGWGSVPTQNLNSVLSAAGLQRIV